MFGGLAWVPAMEAETSPLRCPVCCCINRSETLMLEGNASSFHCAVAQDSQTKGKTAWSCLRLPDTKNRNSWFTSHCEFKVVL